MRKLKKFNSNKITIICMILLISLFSIFTPMATFCVESSTVEISEDLNNSIIEELNEIDFSGLNGIVEEFQNSSTNIFSIENIKSKIYSIISGENAVSYSSFFSSIFSFLDVLAVYLNHTTGKQSVTPSVNSNNLSYLSLSNNFGFAFQDDNL